MSREKIRYVCQNCGYESLKWMGKCPECERWNTFGGEIVRAGDRAQRISTGEKPVPITEVANTAEERFSSGSPELDRVLGGGVLPGSLVLVAGDPGIGKSSLMLKVCASAAAGGGTVLYVTGEESAHQIKMRAERIGAVNEGLLIISETDMHVIEQHVLDVSPRLLVIDSIQAVYSPDVPGVPGSVSQIRESAARIMALTKKNGIATFLIGHVTKEGVLAGPRVLEHMVDTVLYFEGERSAQFRIIRAVKNRFGSTNETGFFEMGESGLRDVPDASVIFLEERPAGVSGSVVVSALEGTRPLLVEVQALVCPSLLAQPRRAAEGIDIRRIQLLIAVLEKRAGILLGGCDVYMKIAGGLTVSEPAVDLGLAVALASSFKERAVDSLTVIFGEVGLSGEVRAVAQADRRVLEAERRGFKHVVLPAGNVKNIPADAGIAVSGVRSVREALDALLG